MKQNFKALKKILLLNLLIYCLVLVKFKNEILNPNNNNNKILILNSTNYIKIKTICPSCIKICMTSQHFLNNMIIRPFIRIFFLSIKVPDLIHI